MCHVPVTGLGAQSYECITYLYIVNEYAHVTIINYLLTYLLTYCTKRSLRLVYKGIAFVKDRVFSQVEGFGDCTFFYRSTCIV